MRQRMHGALAVLQRQRQVYDAAVQRWSVRCGRTVLLRSVLRPRQDLLHRDSDGIGMQGSRRRDLPHGLPRVPVTLKMSSLS